MASARRRPLFSNNCGFITVHYGPAFASQLARYLITIQRVNGATAEAHCGRGVRSPPIGRPQSSATWALGIDSEVYEALGGSFA